MSSKNIALIISAVHKTAIERIFCDTGIGCFLIKGTTYLLKTLLCNIIRFNRSEYREKKNRAASSKGVVGSNGTTIPTIASNVHK